MYVRTYSLELWCEVMHACMHVSPSQSLDWISELAKICYIVCRGYMSIYVSGQTSKLQDVWEINFQVFRNLFF